MFYIKQVYVWSRNLSVTNVSKGKGKPNPRTGHEDQEGE